MPCHVCCYVLPTFNSHLRRIRRPAHIHPLLSSIFLSLQCLASTKMRQNLTSPNTNQTTNQHCHHASNLRANVKLAIESTVAPFPLFFFLLPPFASFLSFETAYFLHVLLLAAWARLRNDVRSKNTNCDCLATGVLSLTFLFYLSLSFTFRFHRVPSPLFL